MEKFSLNANVNDGRNLSALEYAYQNRDLPLIQVQRGAGVACFQHYIGYGY